MIKNISRPAITLPAFLCAVLFTFFALLPSQAVSPAMGGAASVGTSHLLFTPDNTYDIGASGASRPRNLFLGGAINTPGTITSGSLSINSQVYLSANGDGNLNLRVSSTSGSGFSVLSLGGTTSSFPGLKRNGSGFDVRTADDGAYSFADTLYDRHGSGSPEGVVTAPVGASYHRTDGGTSTSLYVKESGSGNTGWVAK